MVYESVGGFLLPIHIVMFLEELPMEDLTNFHHVINELIERKGKENGDKTIGKHAQGTGNP